MHRPTIWKGGENHYDQPKDGPNAPEAFKNKGSYFWLSWGLGATIGIQWMRDGDAQCPEKYVAVSHKEVLSKMSTERK